MNFITKIIGYSALNIPLFSFEWGLPNHPTVLILGGVHGNEIEGVTLARHLQAEFLKSFTFNLHVILVPELNPDGVLLKTRGNGNSVDLNRNLPTKDWSSEFSETKYNPGPSPMSEPENKALIQLIEQNNIKFIFSLHSWHPLINPNGPCEEVASILSQRTGYKIEPDMGYPTPGCLGTFAFREKNIPTITYELERGLSPAKIPNPHTQAFIESLKLLEEQFSK